MSREYTKGKNWLFRIFLIQCTVALLIILSATLFFDVSNNDNYMSNECYSFSKDWKLVYPSEESCDLTVPGKNLSTNPVTIIENKLKEKYDYELTIALYTKHQFVKVFLGDDNEPIYEFDNNSHTLFTRTPGCAWHYITIPEEAYGSTIKIQYTTVIDRCVGEISPIYYGNGKGVLLYIIQSNISGMLVSILTLGISVILFMVFYMVIKRDEGRMKMFYLALFTLLLSVWSFVETGAMQYFISRQEIVNMISHELIMLLPIPIMLYLREDTKKGVRVMMNLLIVIFSIVFIVINTLVCLGISEYADLIYVVHLAIVFTTIILIIIATGKYFERDKDTKKKQLNSRKIGFSILAVAIIMDIVNFQIGLYNDGAACARIGIVFFVIIIGMATMSDIYNVTLMGEKIDLWDKFAHEDVLTGAFNRTAFEEELQDIVNKQTDEDKIAVMSVDVNNLKTINDTYGHNEGDEYIKECTKAIKEVIKDKAKLFRTGGDEFVIIVRNYERGQIMKYISAFEKILRNEVVGYKFPISFAYGYSYFKKNLDNNIYETLKRSDKDMYNKKIEMKKNGVNIRM